MTLVQPSLQRSRPRSRWVETEIPAEHWSHSDCKIACRRLFKAHVNNCHRRLKYYKNKQQQSDKLEPLIPTDSIDTLVTIADKLADKTKERARTKHNEKLTKLLHNNGLKRQKPDKKLGQEYFFPPLKLRPNRNTRTVIVTLKRIPTYAIVSSV